MKKKEKTETGFCGQSEKAGALCGAWCEGRMNTGCVGH